jgi:hypothetical protein
MTRVPKTRNERKKDRVLQEKEFLVCILAAIDEKDLRPVVNEEYAAVTWRHFADKRHQALWRALQVLDFSKGIEERVDILEVETYGEEKVLGAALKELYERAAGPRWFEHELEAAGILALVGGKVYVRELFKPYITATGSYEPATKEFAQKLGFNYLRRK